MKRSEAVKFRAAMVEAAASLDDATASTAPQMFDSMRYGGALIAAGSRINWNGTVKKAAVDLWDTEANNPDNAPTLWADLAYRDGIRIIPEVITATLAFKEGELGWWNDVLYRSKANGNVYTPQQHPENWEPVR